jgi:uncharacterized protein (TIGR03000 family)
MKEDVMTRRVILGAVAAVAMVTGPAAAQYAVRGGPLPPQRGPSLFTGAYAPSFYYGPGPVGYAGAGAGAGYLPNGGAYPANNGFVQPFVIPQTNPMPNYSYYYGSQPTFYYPQAPRTGEPSPPVIPPTSPTLSPGGAVAAGSSTATPPPAAGAAHFTVKVPADAKVWVNDVETRQAGTSRRFHAPGPLDAGRTYEYVFRAQWAENGQTVTRDRTVRFKAGDDLTVDLTEATAR